MVMGMHMVIATPIAMGMVMDMVDGTMAKGTTAMISSQLRV